MRLRLSGVALGMAESSLFMYGMFFFFFFFFQAEDGIRDRDVTGVQTCALPILFGEGEERRDHVLVDDVAALAVRMLMHKSEGSLNAATGQVWSFREIASMVVNQYDTPVKITGSPRQGDMPHGGYRPFDPSATFEAFPDFTYTALPDGLAKVHGETQN